MAENVKINIETDDSSIEGLTRKAKDLKSAMVGVTDPEEFSRLAQEASEAETELRRVNETVRELSGSGDDLARMGSTMGGIGTSLASLDFTAANEGAARMAALSKNMSFASATGSLKQLGGTFAKMGKALLTNPFFLLVGVIAAIVAGIIALMDEMGILTKIFDAVGDAIGFVIQKLKDLLDWFGLTEYAAEDSAKAQIEANDKLIESYKEVSIEKDDELSHEIALMKLRGEETEEAERHRLKVIRESLDKQKEAAIENARFAAQLHGRDSEEFKAKEEELDAIVDEYKKAGRKIEIFEATQKKKARDKEDEDDAKDDKKLDDKLAKAQARREKYAKERKAREEKEAKERKRREQDTADFILDLDRKQQEEKLKLIEDEIERDKKLQLLKLEQQQEDIDFSQMSAEAKLKWDEWYQEEKTRIELDAKEAKDERRAEELAAEKALQKELSDLAIKTENEKQAKAEETAQAKADLEEAQKDGAIDATNAVLDAIIEAAGEGSAAAKAAAIAQTIIAGLQGAVQAFSQSMQLGPIAGPIVGSALAGSIAAMTAMNVNKIASTSTPGKSKGGGGGGSVKPSIPSASQSTPQFQMFGQANEGSEGSSNQFDSQEKPQQQTVKAVVSWSDIEDVSDKDSKTQNEMQL